MNVPASQSFIDMAGVVRLIEHDALACLPERPVDAVRLATLASLLRARPFPVRPPLEEVAQ